VTAQLRAELLRQRSTRTALGLVAAMIALVLLAILLHTLGLPARDLDSADRQLEVLGRGEMLGALFASLLGAISITAEYRHGTIRPTFLVMPRRGRIVAAKVACGMLLGAGFALVAAALAAALGTGSLRARGIAVHLDADDYALLLGGSAVAGSMWAAIGVGIGAILRRQVPTTIGFCAWLLFVEGLLVGDVASVTEVGRFGPGAAAAALTGQNPATLLPPAVGGALLALYAAMAALAGALATMRRDVG
jgi:ABC-type transport system involved in multi-copper enzyme maturation permease subunit